MTRAADIRIGISGWTYPPWRGTFYPPGLSQKQELHHASTMFRSIEINGTFYGLQHPEAFAHWAEQTPDDFVFTVKAPRFITHVRRLRDSELPLANFLASGVLRLGPKLGPILWQFPPSFGFNPPKMDAFLALLPHDTEAAVDRAAKHDSHLKVPAWLKADGVRPLRHALEVRHESFRTPAFIDMLRKHDVALVCADAAVWPRLMDLTSDFVYCRLHGSEELYRSGYDDKTLETWLSRLAAWSCGKTLLDGNFVTSQGDHQPRDVFLFFDNTDKLRAPHDAQALISKVEAWHSSDCGKAL